LPGKPLSGSPDIFFNDSAAATTPPLPAKASAAAPAVCLTKFLRFMIFYLFVN
jgi:hypothetical protein